MVNTFMRRGAGVVAALALTACAPVEPERAAKANPTSAPALITPWMTLSGAWRAPTGAIAPTPIPLPPTVPAPPLAAQRLNFQLPVGVAASGDRVWIADAGWRQLFRLERSRDQLVSLGPYASAFAADHATSMQPTSDGGLWLADPGGRRVIQLDSIGRVRRTLSDERLASRPVAVVATESPGDVYVADSTEAKIVVFEPFGRVLRRFGGDKLQSVAAMVRGPDGLYVVDRLAQQVVVFGFDGAVRLTFGEGTLVSPRAIAVDAARRVFVADDADQRIKVFLDGEPIAVFGGGAGTRFGKIDALAVDGQLLYVADSLNARVQILLVSPESLRVPPSR
jgi:DNA-binding beta-propeller fold protein YncE